MLKPCKKIYLVSLSLLLIIAACRKDKVTPREENKLESSLNTSIDGTSYKLQASAISQNFYIDDGQATGAFELQANLDNTKSLMLFIDKLVSGTITLKQNYPAQMIVSGETAFLTKKTEHSSINKLTNTQAQTGTPPITSYMRFTNGSTNHFAVNGTITITINNNNLSFTWDVTFKNATGKTFKSTGSSTIVNYKKNTKPMSQINNPTSAITISGITPDYALPGDEVILNGVGFSALSSENNITMGNATLTPKAASTNQLKIIVPAYSGVNKPEITVNVLGQTATFKGFIYKPKIASFSPAKTTVGSTVDIYGEAFPENASELEVKIGNVTAEIRENNKGFIKIVVPTGTQTSKISVAYKGKPVILSASNLEVVAGPVSGENSVPIGKSFSGAMSIDFSNKNAVVDYFSGEHSVAIYKTPDGKGNEIGKGKLIISRSGNIFTMKLTGANGTTLSSASVDLTNNNDYNYENLRKIANTFVIGASERISTREDITLTANENGAFYGSISTEGVLRYKFRNNVEHFGLIAPKALASLVGRWEAPHMQPLCQPNIISTVFTADGTVTLKGKSALNCTVNEVINKWDGQDDYVEPNKAGWNVNNIGSMIYLDAGKGGGSMPGGGIWILVSNINTPTSILEVQSYTAGAGGNILVEKPTKK